MKHELIKFELVTDVRDYTKELNKNDLAYHFDDEAIECLDHALTEAECKIVQHNVYEAIVCCDSWNSDIFELLLELTDNEA